eukprot:gb/GECH01006295.1/.p1 GENE.gb/GECH01006295.1/~~gb/GECH01006295.1/.p1  ORF type:complete len:958 (+),score=200.06 gb/GECH01006295.1/:1-2874(+)
MISSPTKLLLPSSPGAFGYQCPPRTLYNDSNYSNPSNSTSNNMNTSDQYFMTFSSQNNTLSQSFQSCFDAVGSPKRNEANHVNNSMFHSPQHPRTQENSPPKMSYSGAMSLPNSPMSINSNSRSHSNLKSRRAISFDEDPVTPPPQETRPIHNKSPWTLSGEAQWDSYNQSCAQQLFSSPYSSFPRVIQNSIRTSNSKESSECVNYRKSHTNNSKPAPQAEAQTVKTQVPPPFAYHTFPPNKTRTRRGLNSDFGQNSIGEKPSQIPANNGPPPVQQVSQPTQLPFQQPNNQVTPNPQPQTQHPTPAPSLRQPFEYTAASAKPFVPINTSYELKNSTVNSEPKNKPIPVPIEPISEPVDRSESPSTKAEYKEFQKHLKNFEKEGYSKACQFAKETLATCKPKIRYKICMDLADLAKRHSDNESDARYWYQEANILDPYASQGWLEHSKMEEECGNLEKSRAIIGQGLDYCPYNEALLIRALKMLEENKDLEGCRTLLARLQEVNVEKTWKVMTEGALIEARFGNISIARDVFKYLTENVSRHGPVYFDAYKLEEKCENYEKALKIVNKGLANCPRYGPLWFAKLHLEEKVADENLDNVRATIKEAVQNMSKELIWKVYYEQAQIEERAGNIEEAKKAYAHSTACALPNLQWKVLVAASRLSMISGQITHARELLNMALKQVPSKSRAQVLIECARLQEYDNNHEKARELIVRAKHETKHEWKVFLEAILMELRAGNVYEAIDEAEHALEIHRGTGRLWAVLIQLKYIDGPDEQYKVFKQAIEEVPKSGEVWCEGARICLNPLSTEFDLARAKRYTEHAIKFTPQYGDSFIESLRAELLINGPQPDDKAIETLCINADPNYGPLWFHCKQNALDSTRQVLKRAKKFLIFEHAKFKSLYQKAIVNSQSAKKDRTTPTDEKYNYSDFITGLYSLNEQYQNINSLDDISRRKIIFGTDQIAM